MLVEFAGAERRPTRRRPEMERLEELFFVPLTEALTLRRMMLGVSQAELNAAIGCADGHLAKWEAGMHRPSLYFLLLWCERLGYRLTLAEPKQ